MAPAEPKASPSGYWWGTMMILRAFISSRWICLAVSRIEQDSIYGLGRGVKGVGGSQMEKIFSRLGSCVVAASLAWLVAVHLFQINDLIFVFWLALASISIVAKLMLAMYFMQGAGLTEYVGLWLKHQRAPDGGIRIWILKVFKMPAKCVFVLGVVLVPIAWLLYMVYDPTADPHQSYIINVRAFAVVAAISVFVAYAHWATHWQEYLFCSECDVKMRLANQGFTPEAIDLLVWPMRKTGIFGPPSR